MNTESQNAKILRHLQSGKKLTPLEALQKFNSLRLGARIFNLRKAGHNIVGKLITTKSGKRVSQYSITK